MGDITVDDITMTGNIIKNDSNLQLTLNNNNVLRINNSRGNVSIGPVNTSFCHFNTDRPKYYFNKMIEINGSINSYRRDLQLNPSGYISNGMIIKKDTGYVGIKTQNPTQALEVNGYVKATGYFNFAGLHESYFKKENKVEVGQLVVSSGLTKNNLVIVEPSTKLKQKNIYGVVENILDGGDNNIAFVKCVGQGKLSVIGPIESGDLITSSNIKGVGIKQDSDIIYNYTLAKALENSNNNETGEKLILVQFLC
jgi:hypothetical protein